MNGNEPRRWTFIPRNHFRCESKDEKETLLGKKKKIERIYGRVKGSRTSQTYFALGNDGREKGKAWHNPGNSSREAHIILKIALPRSRYPFISYNSVIYPSF